MAAIVIAIVPSSTFDVPRREPHPYKVKLPKSISVRVIHKIAVITKSHKIIFSGTDIFPSALYSFLMASLGKRTSAVDLYIIFVKINAVAAITITRIGTASIIQ